MPNLIVLWTFVLVLAIVIGAYWALFEASHKSAKDSLRRRLKIGDTAKATRQALRKVVSEPVSRKPGDTIRARALASLHTLVEQSGLNVTVTGLILAAVGIGVLVFVVVTRFTAQAWLGACAGVAGAVVPYVVVRTARTRRIRRFEESFPEAIDLIARALRAGHTFTTGLEMVADEIPEPVAGEFRRLYDQQNYGLGLGEALKDFAARLPLLDAKFFVTAVLTQREAGGNLAEVLDNLARVIRDRFRVKRQIRVISAHGRLTGWILAGMPPALALFLASQAPENFNVLFSDPLGIRMIVVAIVLQVVGMLIIRRIVNIEY